jgi:DNA repair protein RadC
MSQAAVLPFPSFEEDRSEASRLRRRGAMSLSTEELFRLLIGPRTAALFAALGDRWSEALFLDYRELCERDLDDAEAVAFLACVELARRFARRKVPERLNLSQTWKLASYLCLRYARPDQEVVGAVFLDARYRLLCDEVLHAGTLIRCAVEPRAILRRGLALNARAFAFFHTPPSGDPSPSADDVAFTKRLRQAAEIVGLELSDHLILGATGDWCSFRLQDWFRKPPESS